MGILQVWMSWMASLIETDSGMMQALRWHGRGDLRLDAVSVPVPTASEVLIRVEYVGLCGTDHEEYLRGPIGISAVPVTLGHEVVGVVVASPGNQIPVGTRIIPDVVRSCGSCWWCLRHQLGLCERLMVAGLDLDGGLASYMVSPAQNAVIVPDGLDPKRAVFAEPTSVAVRALRKAGDLSGALVVIVGMGTIGLLVLQVALARGASQIVAIDPLVERRELALALGSNIALSPTDAESYLLEHPRGADVVIECAGSGPAVAAAFAMSRRGGTVVLVGTGQAELSFPARRTVLEELRVFGSAAHVWDEDVIAAISLLTHEIVDPTRLISAVVPLTDAIDKAFRPLLDDAQLLKVLVEV